MFGDIPEKQDNQFKEGRNEDGQLRDKEVSSNSFSQTTSKGKESQQSLYLSQPLFTTEQEQDGPCGKKKSDTDLQLRPARSNSLIPSGLLRENRRRDVSYEGKFCRSNSLIPLQHNASYPKMETLQLPQCSRRYSIASDSSAISSASSLSDIWSVHDVDRRPSPQTLLTKVRQWEGTEYLRWNLVKESEQEGGINSTNFMIGIEEDAQPGEGSCDANSQGLYQGWTMDTLGVGRRGSSISDSGRRSSGIESDFERRSSDDSYKKSWSFSLDRRRSSGLSWDSSDRRSSCWSDGRRDSYFQEEKPLQDFYEDSYERRPEFGEDSQDYGEKEFMFGNVEYRDRRLSGNALSGSQASLISSEGGASASTHPASHLLHSHFQATDAAHLLHSHFAGQQDQPHLHPPHAAPHHMGQHLTQTQHSFSLHPGMKNLPDWLKSLRLHKYSCYFIHLTYPELLQISESDLEQHNITKGARRKILASIQKLKERPKLLRAMNEEVEKVDCDMKRIIIDLEAMLRSPFPMTESSDAKLSEKPSTGQATNQAAGASSGLASDTAKSNFANPPTSGDDSSATDTIATHSAAPGVPSTDPLSQDPAVGVAKTGGVVEAADGDEDIGGEQLAEMMCVTLRKVCTNLLLSPHTDAINVSKFVTLLELCQTGEPFSTTQKQLFASWKQKIRSIWNPVLPRRSSLQFTRRTSYYPNSSAPPPSGRRLSLQTRSQLHSGCWPMRPSTPPNLYLPASHRGLADLVAVTASGAHRPPHPVSLNPATSGGNGCNNNNGGSNSMNTPPCQISIPVPPPPPPPALSASGCGVGSAGSVLRPPMVVAPMTQPQVQLPPQQQQVSVVVTSVMDGPSMVLPSDHHLQHPKGPPPAIGGAGAAGGILLPAPGSSTAGATTAQLLGHLAVQQAELAVLQQQQQQQRSRCVYHPPTTNSMMMKNLSHQQQLPSLEAMARKILSSTSELYPPGFQPALPARQIDESGCGLAVPSSLLPRSLIGQQPQPMGSGKRHSSDGLEGMIHQHHHHHQLQHSLGQQDRERHQLQLQQHRHSTGSIAATGTGHPLYYQQLQQQKQHFHHGGSCPQPQSLQPCPPQHLRPQVHQHQQRPIVVVTTTTSADPTGIDSRRIMGVQDQSCCCSKTKGVGGSATCRSSGGCSGSSCGNCNVGRILGLCPHQATSGSPSPTIGETIVAPEDYRREAFSDQQRTSGREDNSDLVSDPRYIAAPKEDSKALIAYPENPTQQHFLGGQVRSTMPQGLISSMAHPQHQHHLAAASAAGEMHHQPHLTAARERQSSPHLAAGGESQGLSSGCEPDQRHREAGVRSSSGGEGGGKPPQSSELDRDMESLCLSVTRHALD